jgi:DNA-binding transcriptional regulator YiaG
MKQTNQINSLFDKLIKFIDDFKSTTKMIRYRFMNQNELQQIYVSNIKRLRLAQNLSQAELAERVGISVTFM